MSLFYPLKRTTLHIPDTGSAKKREVGHLFIVINDPCPNKCNLLVGVSSAHPKCDKTCILNSGHKFIKHDSFVFYARADIVETGVLIGCEKEGIITYLGLMDEAEFEKIKDGILNSRFTPPRIRKYYKDFCI